MNTETTPQLRTDKEAGIRYHQIIEKGREIFRNTALINPEATITERDLQAIDEFFSVNSPTNPENPWRLQKSNDKNIDKGDIVDTSTYANWDAPGGPLEHIHLATASVPKIINHLREHLRTPDATDPDWVVKAREYLRNVNPAHIMGAAALHDVGRLVTHSFLPTGLIGMRMLGALGIRKDIIDLMPEEGVMLVPEKESMDSKIQGTNPGAVLVRIADEFGKRAPKTNRSYQPEDYSGWDREKWAAGYTKRPPSGRATDRIFAEKLVHTHVANVPRYFEALDKWVQAISTTTLEEITREIDRALSPGLEPLKQP